MLGINGFRSIAVVVLALSVSGAAAAQDAQPTAQPTPAVQATQTSEQQPYLGVRLEDTTDGVIVREVMPDSPAAAAGLQMDDIIQKINDQAIVNVSEVANALRALRPEADITLDISRAGSPMNLTATLAAMPHEITSVLPTDVAFDAFGYTSADKSWQIFSLSEDSPLYTAGLRMGDRITKFNDTAYDPAGLRTFRDGLAADATVKITVDRSGSDTDINVPADHFQALRLFGYEEEGLLFSVPGMTPLAVSMLPDYLPFDAIGFMNADQSWHVFGVAEDSALYEIGLRAGDSITKFNDTAYDPAGLRTFRNGLADDATVSITVARGSDTMNFDVPAADLNILDLFGYENAGMILGFPVSRNQVWLGADIQALTAQVAQQHQVTVNEGALVLGILPNSPAASAGLQPNDVITSVGSNHVDAQHPLLSLLSGHHPGDEITLDVMRGSDNTQVHVTLGQPEISGELPTLMGAF